MTVMLAHGAGPAALSYADLRRLVGDRPGTIDVSCPLCGPLRRAQANRRRPVFRVWIEQGFASFHCARCSEKGWARDGDARRQDPVSLAKVRAEADKRGRVSAAEQLIKARRLWSQRRPIAGTPAELYLRDVRRYRGFLPRTLGFLPPRGEYPPALVSAFGITSEPEPGILAIANSDIRGVHLTRLLRDGSDRERGDKAKIMLGRSAGFPIAIAPPNDLGGLLIAEGIEDALSGHEATGLGAWAAGCASRLPRLADAVPAHVESVTLLADDDDAGLRHSAALAAALQERGIEARCITPGFAKVAA
jgi:hypothetical protein